MIKVPATSEVNKYPLIQYVRRENVFSPKDD